MSDDKITVKVKMTSNNQTYEVSVGTDATVLEFKKEIAEKSQITEKEQNLVYKGRILADDKTIKDYNIQNDHTIILVKKMVDKDEPKSDDLKKNTTTTTTTTTTNTTTTNTNLNDPFSMLGGQGLGGLGNLGGGLGGNLQGVDPSQLNSMLNNPMYMNMMNEMLQDPNTLNMIMNSPQLRPLLDSNPQMREMMSNPQMMQMLLNPQNLQNAMSMMGGQGGTGLGTNTNTNTSSTNTNTNTNTNPFSGFSGLNIGGMGQQTTTQTVDPKVAYKDQNQALKDMGFTNDDLNFEALKATYGNVDAAVERLLNMLN